MDGKNVYWNKKCGILDFVAARKIAFVSTKHESVKQFHMKSRSRRDLSQCFLIRNDTIKAHDVPGMKMLSRFMKSTLKTKFKFPVIKSYCGIMKRKKVILCLIYI